jgi:agmatinase
MTYPDWAQIRRDAFNESLMSQPGLPMLDHETPSFMARPIAHKPEDLQGADIVIIGSSYVAGVEDYAGVSRDDWAAAAKRVRQQSCRYVSGYLQDFDLDIFEHLKIVDYGDAKLPESCLFEATAENALEAQANVEAKVRDVLDAGAIPIVIGQNSPASSFAIAKPISERAKGRVGMVSFDTHWDSEPIDDLIPDPRIAGGASWKGKVFEFLDNFHMENLVEIGERGLLERKEIIRNYLANGAHFFSGWRVKQMGIEAVCAELRHAYEGTEALYAHFDMDVIGGAGPVGGDILGELAEPLGLTEYEVLRIAHEVGRRGLTGLSFICIPPGSKIVYRLIVYVIMYLLAGLILGAANHGEPLE